MNLYIPSRTNGLCSALSVRHIAMVLSGIRHFAIDWEHLYFWAAGFLPEDLTWNMKATETLHLLRWKNKPEGSQGFRNSHFMECSPKQCIVRGALFSLGWPLCRAGHCWHQNRTDVGFFSKRMQRVMGGSVCLDYWSFRMQAEVGFQIWHVPGLVLKREVQSTEKPYTNYIHTAAAAEHQVH